MANSVKARLAAKAARRVTISIGVTDPTDAHEALMRAQVALSLADRDGEPTAAEKKKLAAALTKAQAAYDECFVDVEFQALPSDDYEALIEAHFQPDAEEHQDLVDWSKALPELMAGCCTDTELQDADWWAATLASPEWSNGEHLNLREALRRLNMEIPQRAPKG